MPKITEDYAVFNPRDYLEEYYSTIPRENEDLIHFLVKAFNFMLKGMKLLEFGSGPTMFTALAASRRASEIHLSDFHYANRLELQRWLDRDENSFNWSAYTQLVLQFEKQDASPVAVAKREQVTRSLVRSIMHCDTTRNPSIEETKLIYDAIASNLCFEAVAQNLEQWQKCLQNATMRLRSGGKLILTAVKGSQAYSVGKEVFRVLPLNEQDVALAVQQAGFYKIEIETTPASHPVYAYDGLMFVTATKS
jgi:hypothetical protein